LYLNKWLQYLHEKYHFPVVQIRLLPFYSNWLIFNFLLSESITRINLNKVSHIFWFWLLTWRFSFQRQSLQIPRSSISSGHVVSILPFFLKNLNGPSWCVVNDQNQSNYSKYVTKIWMYTGSEKCGPKNEHIILIPMKRTIVHLLNRI